MFFSFKSFAFRYSFHLWPFHLIHFIRRFCFHFYFNLWSDRVMVFSMVQFTLAIFVHLFVTEPQSVQICMLRIHSNESPPGEVAFVCVCHINHTHPNRF